MHGCSATEPLSGLYIDDLPGISLDSIGKFADEEQATYKQVWIDVEKRAVKKFGTRLTQEFKKRFLLKTLTQTGDIGRYIDATTTLAASAQYRGLTIELEMENSLKLKRSAFQAIHLQTVAVYCAVPPASLTVKVFDLYTGELLQTLTVASPVSGWNSINVYQTYSSHRIFIGVDATLLDTVPQNIEVQKLRECCNAIIRGAVTSNAGSSITDASLTEGNDSYGVTAVFNTGCNYEPLVCSNKKTFALPLWYLMGYEMMIERLFSVRLNRFTTIMRKEAEQLRDYFLDQFNQELTTCIDGIRLDNKDACIECNEPYQVHEMTP